MNQPGKNSLWDSDLPVVLGVTGASGSVYVVRLLQQLVSANREVHLTVSPAACQVFQQELNLAINPEKIDVKRLLGYCWPGLESRWSPLSSDAIESLSGLVHIHGYRDYMTPIASGSFLTAGMIVCPCSGATMANIVHASGGNLIHRAADVHLKEHRPLVLVPRETPLSLFQLENMQRAASAGAVVLPASPGWYHGVTDLLDLIDFVVGRILDHVRIRHQLIHRWADGSEDVS